MPGRRPRSRLTGPSTRATARAAGLSDRQLQHPLVARLSRDTYLPRALTGDLSSRIAAVLLTAPPGAVLSHLTAAALWDLQVPLGDQEDRRVDLIVPAGSAAESRSDRRVHRSGLYDVEVTRVRSFDVTTPARTWRDLAAVLPPDALLAVTDQLLAGRCTREELAAALELRPSGRGCARARAVLPLGDEKAGSPMESVLRWRLHVAGLPAPVLQFGVWDGGRFAGQADMVWEEAKLLVEFDGSVHRDPDVFVQDLRRQNRLVAAGWTILRFSGADVLTRCDEVVAEISRALRAAARPRPDAPL